MKRHSSAGERATNNSRSRAAYGRWRPARSTARGARERQADIFLSGTDQRYLKTDAAYARLVRGGQLFDSFDSLNTGCTLDIDGNGVIDALTNGLLSIRAQFGLKGTAVTNNAIGAGATRTTWEQIRVYLNANCGTNFLP